MIARHVKACAILALLLQAIAVIVIGANPAAGYELGIYQGVPPYAWALLAVSALLSFYVLSYALGAGRGLALALFLILGIGLVFVSLPIIRGYAFYDNYDSLTNVGTVKDVVETGRLDSNDFYPVMHAWVAIVCILGDSSPFIAIKYLLVVVFLLLFLFMVLWSRGISGARWAYLALFASFATIFYLKNDYYNSLVSNGFAMVLVPLLFYLYSKKTLAHAVLLALCLAIMPFAHPLAAMILMAVFAAIELSGRIYARLGGDAGPVDARPLAVLIAASTAWALSYSIFATKLNYALTLVRLGPESPAAIIQSSFGKLDMGLADRLFWISRVYLPEILLGLLALAGAAAILIESRGKGRPPEHKALFPLAVAYFFLGAGLSVLVVAGDPGIEVLRDFNFVFMFSIPLAAYALMRAYPILKSRSLMRFLIVVALIGVPFYVSLFSIYESPYMTYPGKQVTEAQLAGTAWFFTHKDTGFSTAIVPSAAPWRYFDAAFGVVKKYARDDVVYNYDTKNWIDAPDHFTGLAEKLGGRYLTYNRMDYLAYTRLWPIRYDESDFLGLDENRRLFKLYTNDDQVVYYITPG